MIQGVSKHIKNIFSWVVIAYKIDNLAGVTFRLGLEETSNLANDEMQKEKMIKIGETNHFFLNEMHQ